MINDRIDKIIEAMFDGNRRQFSMRIGVHPTIVQNIVAGRRSAPSADLLEKLSISIDNINCRWLLMGEGEMLLPDNTQSCMHKELIEQLKKANQEIGIYKGRLIDNGLSTEIESSKKEVSA